MATSVIEISNRALGRIGISQLIESLDDPNDRARQCRLAYEPCRDEVLQDFPWNFAQSSVSLSLVSGVTVPGWQYAYRYPDACLKVHRVTDQSGARVASLGVFGRDVWDYDSLIPMKTPFQVMADPATDGARLLVTDMPLAVAWFTHEITDPSQFSPLFRSALAWRMAMELALSLKATPALYNNAANQYGWAVSQAQVGSLGEEQVDRYPQSAAVTVRY
jgi:hypothetical protein